ncbi:MAG TPA: methyltransferase domain-containing protein [Solirubrobacteraceae bacterium]|jgi:SAM-dependent methyltransferase
MTRSEAPLTLPPPLDSETVPAFDRGWLYPDGSRRAYLPYVQDDHPVNWSGELEQLHAESGREHFIDVWTRGAMLERIGVLPAQATIVDLGCSSGFLLEDLSAAHPQASLIGIDLVASGLHRAHVLVPGARLVQADACSLPLPACSVDAVLSANLLEHVADDVRALAELRRILRPRAHAVVVVPSGPNTYDYYDRFLGHERRYGRGELARKAREVGLEVLLDIHLGSLLYPPFWLTKQLNRRRFGHLRGAALEQRVAADIARTNDSLAGRTLCRLERRLLGAGLRLPFGIRGLTVLRCPEHSP